MNLRVTKLYSLAMNDTLFLKEVYEADNDKKPAKFPDDKMKALWAIMYYGWLVGKGLWKPEMVNS